MKITRTFSLFILLLGNPVLVEAEWYSHESQIFGTAFGLEFWVDDIQLAEGSSLAEGSQTADQAVEQVVAEMWRLHHMLSPYEEESELSYINKNAFSKTVAISGEMVSLLSKSLHYSKLTQGAFDPSFSSVGQYYDYRAGEKPDQKQIEEFKQAINYRLIELDEEHQTVKLNHQYMALDLGGIAKGYAMDKAADILISLGIKHASISAGGDMRILGDKRGRPWVIGIRNPRQKNTSQKITNQKETAIRLPLENVAVSTSGDYERFFIDEETGERIHHILNPSTGESAAELTSVTMLGEKGFDTDPLSTSVFVLGVEKGLKLINKMPEYDAILIDTAGKVYFSDGLVAP